MNKNRLALTLFLIFLPFWVFTAFVAYDIRVWLAESFVTFVGLAYIYLQHRRGIFSKATYWMIFIYLLLAKVGVTYGYENVPFDQLVERLLGFSPGEELGFGRNHYDRFVHFVFGLLFYLPVYEYLMAISGLKSRGWLHFITFLFLTTASAVYEMIEMVGSWLSADGAYLVYLSHQGDVLDAPKDMALALLGTLLAMGILLLRQRRRTLPAAACLLLLACATAVMSLPCTHANPHLHAFGVTQEEVHLPGGNSFHTGSGPGVSMTLPIGAVQSGDNPGEIVYICDANAETIETGIMPATNLSHEASLSGIAQSNPTSDEAVEIIRRSLERYHDISMVAGVTMLVVRPTWESEVGIRLWSKGDDYALVLITAPARDRGQSFLKRGSDLWQWIPSIERTVRMSDALLMQSWMGSDFTLGDLIRNRSMADDYEAVVLGLEPVNGVPCHHIGLVPHPDAPVVWSRVEVWISEAHYDQMKACFYDEHNNLVRVMEADGFKSHSSRRMPEHIRMTQVNRPGHFTTLQFASYDFDRILDEDFFSLQQMKRAR